jgi:hypothetical protein
MSIRTHHPEKSRLLRTALRVAAALVAAGPAAGAVPPDDPLNPQLGDYYSLYCLSDALEVWRSVPADEQLTTVSIAQVVSLGQGESLELDDFMTLARDAADVATVYGSNGNQAPLAGSKSFSLSECIGRNGGLPDEPPPPPEEEPSAGDIQDRIQCAFCPECVLFALLDDIMGLVDGGSFQYPFWQAFLQDSIGPCAVVCIDTVAGVPVPADLLGIAGASGRARTPGIPGPRTSEIFLLYAVRQQILETAPRGRHLRELYYAHTDEILRLLIANWGRWDEAFDTLVRFQPHLLALVEGRGAEVVVSAEDVQAVDRFLDHLAAAASPALASVLAQERAAAQLGQLVGLNMEQARRVLVGPASCPDAPDPACEGGFAKASLVVDERKTGKEKLALKLRKGPELAQSDLGDPTAAGGTEVSLCLYDDGDALAGALGVARAGESCGRKPCWKPIGGAPPAGKGFAYKDKGGLSDGLRKLQWKGGAAGKSSVAAAASNRAKRSETRLPDGLAAALAATSRVTVQVRASDGACVAAELGQVITQRPDFFKAR